MPLSNKKCLPSCLAAVCSEFHLGLWLIQHIKQPKTMLHLCVLDTGKSTQTGKAILKLQLNLPSAKILYSSATGASEPNNLAYMIRLGTCGYATMTDLVSELNK